MCARSISRCFGGEHLLRAIPFRLSRCLQQQRACIWQNQNRNFVFTMRTHLSCFLANFACHGKGPRPPARVIRAHFHVPESKNAKKSKAQSRPGATRNERRQLLQPCGSPWHVECATPCLGRAKQASNKSRTQNRVSLLCAKPLVVTGASLVVTGALLVVTRSY